jgi:hypothetical protein
MIADMFGHVGEDMRTESSARRHQTHDGQGVTTQNPVRALLDVCVNCTNTDSVYSYLLKCCSQPKIVDYFYNLQVKNLTAGQKFEYEGTNEGESQFFVSNMEAGSNK